MQLIGCALLQGFQRADRARVIRGRRAVVLDAPHLPRPRRGLRCVRRGRADEERHRRQRTQDGSVEVVRPPRVSEACVRGGLHCR